MERLFFQLAGLNGFLAVALGAFGAHGLKSRLDGLEDAALRLEWWNTAAHYQLTHALALALAGYLAARVPGRLPACAGWGFQVGILLFSGSLYAMTLSGMRGLGAITPLGGLGILFGWVCVILAAGNMGSAD